MTLDLARVQRLTELLCEKRANVTGERMSGPDTTSWPAEADTEALFMRLVTSMYVWFHEAWGDEVHYLIEAAAKVGVGTSDVRAFAGLIVDLRTSHQHSPNADSARRSQRWFRATSGAGAPGSAEQWERCALELVASCKRALSVLIDVIKAIQTDPAAADEWCARVSASVAADPAAQLAVILADLGLDPSPSQRAHLERQLTYDWRRRLNALTGSDDVAGELSSTIERVVVGWTLSHLPCGYDQVLDFAEVSPGDEAIGALELAHALADLCEYETGDEFLDLFARIWDAVRDAGR